MSWFIKIFSSILAFFIFSSSSGEVAVYSPNDKDNIRTSFTVISDAHLEGNNKQKHKAFGEFLLDTASAEVKSSALVMCGDNTMNGQSIEMSMLYGLIDKYNTIDNVLMVAGNHDICPGKHNSGDYDDLKNRFIKYNNTFLDNKIDNLYHSEVIDGYHFIVLASDRDAGIAQYISPEQFEWLDNELKSAAESGKPVFLFSHWPLNNVFEDVWQEGHVGEQSEELYDLIKKYDNRVFFFTGHLHMGIYKNDYGVKNDGKITYINVPSFGSVNDDGDADIQDTGLGLQVEVYDKEIAVKIRDFVNHEWTDFEYRFDI
ncbi:MAG: metallophosphoesterase [Eubacterium sp.]|nr:metallophosphoesterase [Eubacterium sp.]